MQSTLENLILENNFVFNNEVFFQCDGLSMGGPLSAVIANIFMSYHETQWLKECPVEFRPLNVQEICG